MDKKYQDIHFKIKSQDILTIREIQLLSLIKNQNIIIEYVKDKKYTLVIPILPFMQIIID